MQVKGAWAGFYDYNTWDQNAFVGNHPYHANVFFATGFSGHGKFCSTCLNGSLFYYKTPRNVQNCLINIYFHDLGIQQAPAIGRAIAELIYDDDFQTIDLTRFLFDRMLNDVKMMEAAIV